MTGYTVEIPRDGRTQVLPERIFSIIWICRGILPDELSVEEQISWRSAPHEGTTTANGFIDARMPQNVLKDHEACCKAKNHKFRYYFNFITS